MMQPDDAVFILTQIAETYLPTSNNEAVLAQDSDRSPISSYLVLLLDSNLPLTCFIHPTRTPIKVHCNKSTLQPSEEATFGDIPIYFGVRLSLIHI